MKKEISFFHPLKVLLSIFCHYLLAIGAIATGNLDLTTTNIRCSQFLLDPALITSTQYALSAIVFEAATHGYSFATKSNALPGQNVMYCAGGCSHMIGDDECTQCLGVALDLIWLYCRSSDIALLGLGSCFISYSKYPIPLYG